MVDFVSLFTGMSERDIGYLLKNIVQDSINSELTNSEISEIDEKTSVLITNSKDIELMNDISVQSAINIEPSTTYLMPEEPDGVNLKLWLKFQNIGELKDWSYQKNKSYSTGGNTMPGLFSKHNDHSMMKYELYSYFNGISHYAYTLDSPAVRILPNITASKITSFFMRLVPVSLAKFLYAENNALFTKVDDDQLRYGYSVTVDVNGTLHFYIRNNYRQYYLSVPDAYNYILTDPLYDSEANFLFDNYNRKSFLIGFQYLCGLVDAELPFHDWFFKYNPTSHAMSIIKTIEGNSASLVSDTSLITEIPYLSCPMQEGKWTHSGTVQSTIYDNSGHGNNATISGYLTGGTWNDDNTLTSLGSNSGGTSGGMSIDFSTITSLQTLTEFTISFWYNPLTELINSKSYNTRLFSKGYAIANSIYIERTSGLNNLKFSFRGSDNVEKSVTYSNPFPSINKWYMVTAKWKSGEKLKLYINDSLVESASTITTTLSTAGNLIKLYSTTNAPIGIMALFKMDNKQVQQSTQDRWFYEGYHNPLFPKSENIQPVPEEDPDPILVPFTNVYTLDKMAIPVIGDYRKINSLSGDNPFIERYSVADGTSSTNTELLPYIITDGSTTAADPETRVGSAPATIDSSANSSGKVGSSENDMYGLKIDATAGTGIGDTMIGKVLTKAIVWMRKEDSSVTGTLYFRIWNSSATNISTPVATLGSYTANSLPQGTSSSDWVPITFQNTANTVALADGYRIGIEYQGYGSSDVVDIQRQSPRAENTTIQTTYDGSWNTNSSFTMKCDLYTGAGTVATEPNIIMKSGSNNAVVETIGTGDSLIGKNIGKITLRLKKVGSPTGTATIAIVSSASTITIKATLGTLDVSTLTTSTADYSFSNYLHGYEAVVTDRIGIIWTPSASGEVHVMTNKGNDSGSNVWNGTNSSVFTHISSWSSTGLTAYDLAAKIYTGGDSFDAWLRFSTVRTRITSKAVNSASSIHNRKITKVVIRAKKVGSPTGIISCYLRDSSDNIKVTYSSVDVSTLSTSYANVEFTNVVHTYLVNSATGSADKISIEYSGSTVSDYVELNVNRDVLDGLNTIGQTYDSGNYVDRANIDIAGKMYDGGEPDLTSRTRVVQSIEHQNSRLKAKKITKVKAFLIRTTTSTTGTAYCNIRKSTDDSLVKTLGTVSVSSLNTTVNIPSEITFTDTTNNYPLNVGDKISIEFNGGNSTDQLGVLVREMTPNYDGSNSYIRKFDEVDYDDSEPTKDLCAIMDEGGFMITPDPGSIPDPTPTNIKDLLYLAGNNAKSGFMQAFLMEFRIYAKDITLGNADNLYNNRYSISNIGDGQILCPFSFRPVTLDPV